MITNLSYGALATGYRVDTGKAVQVVREVIRTGSWVKVIFWDGSQRVTRADVKVKVAW